MLKIVLKIAAPKRQIYKKTFVRLRLMSNKSARQCLNSFILTLTALESFCMNHTDQRVFST